MLNIFVAEVRLQRPGVMTSVCKRVSSLVLLTANSSIGPPRGVRACGKIWVVNLLVSQRPLPGARGDWMFSSSISVASCGGGAVLILVLRAVQEVKAPAMT